jgi:hypothetical protein
VLWLHGWWRKEARNDQTPLEVLYSKWTQLARFQRTRAEADLEPGQVQDLGDMVPKFLEIKNKTNTPIRFHIRIEMGDGKTLPPKDAAREASALLKSIRKDLELKR